MMADVIDEQVTAHICEILHLVHSVKGKMLCKLNELVGQMSKFNVTNSINIRKGTHQDWSEARSIGSSKYKNLKLRKEEKWCCSKDCF